MTAPESQFTPRRCLVAHAGPVFLLALVCAVLFIYQFASRGLWSAHEGRAGQHAQVMLDTGRWGMPELYWGRSDYQKPPLYYWLVAGLARLRGGAVDAWAVRFPAVATACIAIGVVYCHAQQAWGRTTGLVAALVTAANLRFTWLARVGRIDMPMTLAIAACLACLWQAWKLRDAEAGSRRVWLIAAYLAVSAAILLKGPIGALLPAITIAGFVALQDGWTSPLRRAYWAELRHFGPAWGIPLALAVAAPWFVWATWKSGGEFFRTFFLYHHLTRSMGAEGLKPEPVWYYLPQLFVDLFPWSCLIPASLVHAWRRRATDSAARLALAWFLSMLTFLSLVRFKRHDYLLPLVPGIALLIAGYWHRLISRDPATSLWRWAYGLAISIAVPMVAIGLSVLALRNAGTGRAIVGVLSELLDLNESDRLVLNAIRQAADQLTLFPVALCVVGVPMAVTLLLCVRLRRPVALAGLVAAGWSSMCLLYFGQMLPTLEPLRDQRAIGQIARQIAGGGASLYYYGWEDQQLMFCIGRPVRWLRNRNRLRRVLDRPEPAFVVMDLPRYEARRAEWPGVHMTVLARNTDNPFGTHRDPVVVIGNDAGAAWANRRHGTAPVAN